MAGPADVKPDPIVALRETSECLLLTQREMAKDIGEMAMAVTEMTKAAENLTAALATVEELKRAVEQLGDVFTEYPRKLAELFDAQRETASQLGRYITDASKKESGIRQVDERLRALELTLGQR